MKPNNIRCMKFFLTLCNIICILIGLILMTICVVNVRDRKSRPEQSRVSRGVLSFLLTLGLGLVVSAALGCVGALRLNVKMLYVHACFFIFLVSVEVMVTMGGAVLSAWVGGTSELRVSFYRNNTTEDDGSRAFWSNLESENECCGVGGPQDYELLSVEIPFSCCPRGYRLKRGVPKRHLHASCISEKTYHQRGCEEVLDQQKAVKGKIFITTGVLFALLEMVCIVLAIWMARITKNERRRLQESLQAHFES